MREMKISVRGLMHLPQTEAGGKGVPFIPSCPGKAAGGEGRRVGGIESEVEVSAHDDGGGRGDGAERGQLSGLSGDGSRRIAR